MNAETCSARTVNKRKMAEKQLLHFVVKDFGFSSSGRWDEMFLENAQNVGTNILKLLFNLQISGKEKGNKLN